MASLSFSFSPEANNGSGTGAYTGYCVLNNFRLQTPSERIVELGSARVKWNAGVTFHKSEYQPGYTAHTTSLTHDITEVSQLYHGFDTDKIVEVVVSDTPTGSKYNFYKIDGSGFCEINFTSSGITVWLYSDTNYSSETFTLNYYKMFVTNYADDTTTNGALIYNRASGYFAASDLDTDPLWTVYGSQITTELGGGSSLTTTCNYQLYVDGSSIDSDIFSNIESDPSATTSFSDKSFVLVLDRSASHTVKMINLTTGLVSSSADWKVNDSTTLPSGWTKSNGILTIPANATANSDNIDPYNIEGTVGECSEDMKIRIVAPSPTVPTIEDTGLGVGMTTGNITQYIAYYSNDGTFKTNETGTATGLPVSLTAREGLAVSTVDNKFIVSVPYDSAGYKFCVLDSSDIDDDGDPVVDALEGFVADKVTTNYGILWGVRFPDGTGTAVRHYTRIPITDAGDYEITALACNGNLAKSDNVDTIYVQIVNTIRLTVLPVINVSWIACSYEGSVTPG